MIEIPRWFPPDLYWPPLEASGEPCKLMKPIPAIDRMPWWAQAENVRHFNVTTE